MISQQACGGASLRRKRLLDGVVGLLSRIWQHITTVSFVSAFILFWLGGPQATPNWSEWGINITMSFSKINCLDHLYTGGLVNLTCMLVKHVMPTWGFTYPPFYARMAKGPTICICDISVWCQEVWWVAAKWIDTFELDPIIPRECTVKYIPHLEIMW